MRTYATLPSLPDAGRLDRYQDLLGVIVPIARTNLILNPSFETNTTSWTASGASIARSTTSQYHGAYSLAITPTAATTDGAYYGTVSLTSGTTYAISAKVLGVAGRPYKLSVATTAGVDLASKAFTGTGKWQWIWLFWTETSSTTRRIYCTKNGGTSTGVFYLDGVQVEACGSEGVFVTTYIDGDQQGYVANQFPAAYGWNGTRHASTSFRSGQTRAGGRIVKFTDLGFLLTTIIGLGMGSPTYDVLNYAQLDGANYRNAIKQQRSVSFVGQWQGSSPTRMDAGMGKLGRLLDRDRIGLRQELALCLQARECNADIGEPVTIPRAVYASGLDGNTQELPAATANITFNQYLPYVIGRDGGALLSAQTTFASSGLIQRSASGTWAALGSGANANLVGELVYGPDGSLYAGGSFTSMGGVANTSGVARWDGSAWNALGTGASGGSVSTLVFDAAGNLYAGGSFTSMGGVANTLSIAKWNGSAWSALGTGANSQVITIAIAPDGTLYAGGAFTSAGGVGTTNYIAKWNGSAWSSIGNAGSFVYALAVAKDGTLYAGGAFTDIGAVGVNYIAKWNGTIWSKLGLSGLGSVTIGVLALAFDQSGLLYIGGDFTTDGLFVPLLRLATWNGTAFQQVGGGIPSGSVATLVVAPDNTLYIGGSMSRAGSLVFPQGAVRWNGSTFLYVDAILPGSDAVQSYAFRPDGVMTMGFTVIAGNITAPVVTSTNNSGTASTSPRLIITGPTSGSSIIYELLNTTTNTSIYFNLTLLAGETAILNLDPQNLSFTSSIRGNIYSTIVAGSQTTLFALQPGANNLVFFCDSSTVTATLSWQTRYTNLNDALYQAVDP